MSMPVRITLEVSPLTANPIVIARTVDAQGVDRVQTTVPSGADVELPLQPGDADDLQLLVITASAYGADLSYRVGGSTVDIVLDQPHVFHGAGMIDRLPVNPSAITVANGLGQDVVVDVLVARTITP